MPGTRTIRPLREDAAPAAPRPHPTMPPPAPPLGARPVSASRYRLFGLLRFYSVVSVVGFVAATIMLTSLYRHVAIGDIVSFGERSNLALAQGFLNVVRQPIVSYLTREEAHHGPDLPADLERAVQALMQDTTVARVKIYDDEGVVTYSTREHQIGTVASNNEGFRSAMRGSVVSRLTYRDSFNHFDGETESDNLIQSYVPIRTHAGAPILGVFEIYTDVNPMVGEIERAQFLVLGGSAGVLMLLYFSSLAIVRHAERIIKGQQQSIRERSHALEVLSSQLLTAQEQEKQRVAHELHEGILQTLGSIKYQVESAGAGSDGATRKPPLDTLIPHLQAAIKEVRSLAMELRPSSLDDLGVVATLNWFCREFRGIHRDLTLAHDIRVQEADISPALKVILYRLTQQTLQYFARCDGTTRIELSLTRAAAGIRLQLSNHGDAKSGDDESDAFWLALQERVALSGGHAGLVDNGEGGVTLTAVWAG